MNVTGSGYDWCGNVEVESFKDAEPYTAQDFADAYCDVVTFNGEHGLTDDLSRTRDDYADDEIAFVRDFLTADGYQALEKDYDGARSHMKKNGPEDSGQDGLDVNLLTGLALENDEFSFTDPEALTAGRTWSPAEFYVDKVKDNKGQPRIGFELTFTEDLLLENEGKDVIVPRERKMTYWMSRNDGDNPKWLIDGWKGVLEYTEIKPIKVEG